MRTRREKPELRLIASKRRSGAPARPVVAAVMAMLLLMAATPFIQREQVARWTELVASQVGGDFGLPEADAMNDARAAAQAMPICRDGRRVSCVVDGDTMWLKGEKIRLSGIDAPEVRGECPHETELAATATRRLSQLVSHQAINVERNGQDRYGRTLARVSTGQGEVGAILVREGLARRWTGRREGWCDARSVVGRS